MSTSGEANDLTDEERRNIDEVHSRLKGATFYDLLGVPRDAERRAIRDAYFALSKRFHPEVFFKRSLGLYRTRIDEVFRAFTQAYDTLGNAKERAAYDGRIAALGPGAAPVSPIAAVADIVSRPSVAPPRPGPTAQSQPRVAPVDSLPPPGPRTSLTPPSTPTLPPPMHSTPRPMTPLGTAVVPHVVTPTPSRPAPPPAPLPAPTGQPVDPETMRRAREAMARRLGSVFPGMPKPGSSSRNAIPAVAPAPAPHASTTAANDRGSAVGHFLSVADEAQKKGDFAAATEALKNAMEMQLGDEALRLRYEAMRKLMVAQQADLNITLAREAMADARAAQAARHWELAYEGRNDPQLLLNAAEILMKYTKEYKKAADLAQRALQHNPDNVKAHVLLANVFLKGGLRASARASIDTVARLAPEHASLKELREKFGPLSIAEQLRIRGR